jgi:Ricin-type beta-trefoil lectin domain/Collagen triple helix repeat (20 copies)
MSRSLNRQITSSGSDAAIKELQSTTQGLNYTNGYASLTGVSGGKLSGKDTALTWDAQGNVTFSSKVLLNGNDLQNTLDTIKKMPGPAGPQGLQGPIGPMGTRGPAGPAGTRGALGLTGPAGPAGTRGALGLTGPAGPAGKDGLLGPMGPVGPTGALGPMGLTGPAGKDGLLGPVGPAGPAGAIGTRGALGLTGPTGALGPMGPMGPAGPIGTRGALGLTGPTGALGPMGPMGPAGKDGLLGPMGPAGPTGALGPMGPMGPAGKDGLPGPAGNYTTVVDFVLGNGTAVAERGSVGQGRAVVRDFGAALTINYAGDFPGGVNVQGKGLNVDGGLIASKRDILKELSDLKASGIIGPAGPMGPMGPVGALGPMGPAGALGPIGTRGALGLTGPAGTRGALGLTGPAGPAGPIGTRGALGLTGPAGPMGPAGALGPIGPAGPAGPGFTGDNVKIKNLHLTNIANGVQIHSDGAEGLSRMHTSGQDELYILNKKGAVIGKEWGGNGNLTAQGNITAAGNIRANAINTFGFGPYQVRFFDKNKCLDVTQMDNNNQRGDWDCVSHTNQQFLYNPVTGHLKHAHSNKCLDTMGTDQWRMNTCNEHPNQRFWRKEHLLQHSNGACLDTGNNNHQSGCDGNNGNQRFTFNNI